MYVINCDCSIEPFNPGGILAWAFIVRRNKKVIHEKCGTSLRGRGATNNVGEYHAVIAALLWLLKLPPEEHHPAFIMSDSQLIINQCNGDWRCKDEKLIPLHAMALKAQEEYNKSITFKWISRDKNGEVDALSRTAYDEDELEYFRKNQLDIAFEGDDVSW